MKKKFTAAFFGTPEFSANCLSAITKIENIEVVVVITQPDKPAGRGKQMKYSAAKKLALELGIHILQPKSIKKNIDEFIKNLDSIGKPDFAVVSVFAQILPTKLLNYFSGYCVNVHPSLLPRWRGASPIHRAMLAGDKETGVCLMRMEEGLDSGPYWSIEKLPISEDDTHGDLQNKLGEISIKLLQRDLVKIITNQIPEIPQSTIGITYAEKLTNETTKIDWSKPANEVANHCRGLWSSPGAYTFLNEKRLKLGLTKVYSTQGIIDLSDTFNSENQNSLPGTILSKSKDYFVVKCGAGAVMIFQLQPEGKNQQTARDFMNGNKINIGDRLTTIPARRSCPGASPLSV